MKKRIIAILLLTPYLFISGSFVFAEGEEPPIPTVVVTPTIPVKADTSNSNSVQPITADELGKLPVTTAQDVLNNKPNTPSGTPVGACEGASKSNMLCPGFTFNPSNLSPSKKVYNGGTKQNIADFLATIGKYLLIATTTISILSIAVGGIMIATTGPTDRAAKGKTIITLNIMGVVIALFSYSIIRFVSWLISA